jgi:Putative Flp pilus-assembly TadE/G-like
MTSSRHQRGQAMVISLLFLTVLLAMSAAVLDVGAWYRAHRQTQATADATALAGAQKLPSDPGGAQTLALDYAGRNGGGVLGGDIEISTTNNANDTIAVTARKTVPGFFTKLFGLDSVTARQKAKARVGGMDSAKWAAPIGVDYLHDDLNCTPSLQCSPAFDQPTQIDFFKVGPGAFRLINIDGSHGGTGPPELGDWIRTGLDKFMPNNRWYYSDPGMKPNSSHVKSALDDRIGVGKELLLPIYTQTRGSGSGFEYYVVAWVGYQITSWDIRGSNRAVIDGMFTRIIWEGIQSEHGSDDGLGAKSVQLVE